MAACSSCGRPIFWAETDSGKKIPIDATPLGAGLPGNVVLCDGMAKVVRRGSGTHITHFVTCPNAAEHRKKPRNQGDLDL